LFPPEKLNLEFFTFEYIFDLFKDCFFPSGIWVPQECLKYISHALNVNVQVYVPNTRDGSRGGTFKFLTQEGEYTYSDTILLAFIPYNLSLNTTFRGTTRWTGHDPKDMDRNHYNALLLKDSINCVFEVSKGLGGTTSSAYVGSKFTSTRWIEPEVTQLKKKRVQERVNVRDTKNI
jgi:hypothetical protein